MPEIIPAIMPHSFADLREHISRVSGAVSLVQIDVMDGKFVSGSSWPYAKHDDSFERMLAEEEGLPEWETIDYEIDLMVADTEDKIAEWVSVGAKRLVIHAESVAPRYEKEAKGDRGENGEGRDTGSGKKERAIADRALDLGILIRKLRAEYGTPHDSLFAPELGAAIEIDTPTEILNDALADLDFVQFMGIARIGFQGQPFDERVLEKIADFRGLHPHMPISVDGGVHFDTAPLLVNAGATRLVAGSAVFDSTNPLGAIRELASPNPEK